MGGDDDAFWNDLLGHIRDRNLVTVVGPDVTVVKPGEQTLSKLIGQSLAKQYPAAVSSGMTMGEAVAAIFAQPGGPREVEYRLYSRIKHIINELKPAPGDALCDLASITDLRLFVSTTPDSLLAMAVKKVRSEGRIRELTASSNRATSEQPSNEPEPAATDTVILSLFGQAASTRQYAIHEEDRLEWLHAFVRDEASLPDWLAPQLRAQPILFLGCEIPDWLGPFLLRMSSNNRLGSAGKQFFVVPSIEPPLNFFETYCDTPQVQELHGVAPTEFVTELRRRWEESKPLDGSPPGSSAPRSPEIFISYMREDATLPGGYVTPSPSLWRGLSVAGRADG